MNKKETKLEKIKEAYEKTKEKAKAADEYIKANPYLSMAMATGVALVGGVLLGYALGKKKID